MKIFANIENNGYWVPGGTYYVDIWEVSSGTETEDDYESCPVSGVRILAQGTTILRADSEIVADAGSGAEGTYWGFGANGEFTEENPPVFDFETSEQTLDDWVGNLQVVDAETLQEGNNRKLVRYYISVCEDAEPCTCYLKIGSYNSGTCLGL